MKIIVAAIGSRGDVQPYINLCQGLQERGHHVTLATNPTLCPLAAWHGIQSAPVGPAVDMGEVGARLMDGSFNNMWIGMLRVMQVGARLVEQAFPDVLELCRGADLVITTDTTSGIAEAEKLGLPWISVTLQPARIPAPKTNPTLLDRTLWPLLSKLFILPTNRFRKRIGAPPAKDLTDMMSKRMLLLPVSRHVAPPEPHWPRHVFQTGYWVTRPPKEWSPPEDLLRFLQDGEKPIAVSLGVMSLSGKRARESAQIVLQALRQAGARAVIQGWDEVLIKDLNPPETVYHAGSMPHSWLFEQVSAVVHHGGFGTTAAVLSSGAPGIVVPHVIDQFYWGQRVFELGAGPKFISRGRLTVQGLSEAIRQVQDDERMRARAAELGDCIRAEPDGVAAAVDLIETLNGVPVGSA